MSFYALRVSFEKFFFTFTEELHKLFWTRLEEKVFAFIGKWMEHLERREILCVHLPEFYNVSAGPGYRMLREWIRSLYNNVNDRLFEATSQSTTERTVQKLLLDSNQLALIWFLMCTKWIDFHHITGRFEEKKVRVLELNVSPRFALMKQVVLIIISTQPTESSGSSNIDKCFWTTSFFTWIVTVNSWFVPLFLIESTISKFTPWANSTSSFSFCITS